jgi:hypothetical protein
MFQQLRIAAGTDTPVVPERDAGQIQAGLRGVHDPWQSGERQITAQNPVRASAAEGGNESADASHPSTLAHTCPHQR